MAHVFSDRVQETTTTTGTGTLNLDGAATKFRTFVAGIATGNTVDYAIVHRSAAEWEVGRGTVTDASPDTLSRTTILASSNAGSAVNFSAGTKDVFCSRAAASMPNLGTTKFTASDTAPTSPATDDRWYETDTNIEWFWNGTYWLSTELFYIQRDMNTPTDGFQIFMSTTEIDQAIQHDLFFVDLVSVSYASQSSGVYWTINAKYLPAAGGAGTTIGSHNTNNNTSSNYVCERSALDTHVDLSAVDAKIITLTFVKTGTPGDISGNAGITYRLAHHNP